MYFRLGNDRLESVVDKWAKLITSPLLTIWCGAFQELKHLRHVPIDGI